MGDDGNKITRYSIPFAAQGDGIVCMQNNNNVHDCVLLSLPDSFLGMGRRSTPRSPNNRATSPDKTKDLYIVIKE